MKKLSLRENTGDWIYYLTALKYDEIRLYVKKIDDELHKSKSLNEMIQRSLTDNVSSIAAYITNQKEHFFNALVLAVYDGDPQWREVRLDYGDGETYELGILEFNGDEKIFPVDGQHRVEGIKRALMQDESLANETIPVIFIGHKNTSSGLQRTRRLFSTLNRYAKPVSLNDIIALDEDDIVAITTRHLIENNPLFKETRLNNHKQKAIPEKDKTAFTNIITLYECNSELLAYFIRDQKVFFEGKELRGKRKLQEYCRRRPEEGCITQFTRFVDDFWCNFAEHISSINEYLQFNLDDRPAEKFRNSNGGSVLFRPVGQRPVVLCALSLYDIYKDFAIVMQYINRVEFELDSELWKSIAWNPVSKKMIASSNGKVIELILKYTTNVPLSEKDKKMLIAGILSLKGDENLTEDDVWGVLNQYRLTV